jgi:hypothetical protein
MCETQQKMGRGKGGEVDLESRRKVGHRRGQSMFTMMPAPWPIPVYLFSLQSLATFDVGEAAETAHLLSDWPHSSDLKM